MLWEDHLQIIVPQERKEEEGAKGSCRRTKVEAEQKVEDRQELGRMLIL